MPRRLPQLRSTGGEAAPAAGEASGVTMSFWTRDSNQAQVRALVDAWNATHDNQIEVTVIPAADYMTKVGAAAAGGSAPDIIAVDLIYVPQFAAANQLTDITESAKSLPYFDKLSPSHVRLATYEDKIYAPAVQRRRLDPAVEQGPVQGSRSGPREGRRQPGPRSPRPPRRSRRWAMTSTASTSPARAPAATPSPTCP